MPAMMVWMEPIFSSYSLKPVVIGSTVNVEARRFPAFIAELVIFERAVIAMTSSAENFILTVSTDLPSVDISHFLAALSMFSRPFAAPFKSKLCLSLSSVEMLV